MSEQTENKIDEELEENKDLAAVSEEDIEAAKEAEPEDIKEKEPINWKNEILEWFESFIFALLVVQLVFIFLLRVVMVDGDSMKETLHDGDRLIMAHVNYTPERDDIVVINSDVVGKIIIKRVIGLAGDEVVVDYNKNHVYVNGQQISNEHIKEIMLDRGFFDMAYMTDWGVYEYTVPEGSIFVMGDNRNDSKDSRSIGFIDEESVLGKAVFRIYPLDKFGSVD